MKIIKLHAGPIDPIRPPEEDLRFEYCPPLHWGYPLDWGPQHVDLETQELMRCCYFRIPSAGNHLMESYSSALASGDEVAFWCEPILPSCLGILWALEALTARGADLRNASLVLSPARSYIENLDPQAIREAVAQRIPAGEVLAPLIPVRRHLASDSEEVRADLSALPQPLQSWAAVTDRLEDFLPDERGLDMIDWDLLHLLVEEAAPGEEWVGAATILGHSDTYPEGHSLDVDRYWERLLEWSGGYPSTHGGGDPLDRLIEARFTEEPFPGLARYRKAQFRLTELGRRVREGQVDTLPLCPFPRWVGGRLISVSRPLRRKAP